MFKSSITAVVFTLALGAVPAFAQQAAPPAQQPPARAEQSPIVRGELVSVDETAKTITVKTADAEVKFAFDDKTEVTGAKDAAGLATMSASRVTVHYTEDAATKTRLATRIIVEPKQ